MPDQEFRVVPVADLPPAPGLHPFEVAGVKLLLVRLPDGLHAVDALCPHAQAPLAEGALCGRRLVCPWHHSVFDVTDGALLDPPALDGLRAYPVRVEAGHVFVTLPEKPAEPPRVSDPAAAPGPGKTVVVIGAGAAGQAAAEALRGEGFAGRLVLIGREDDPPYDRTNLSKHFLTGDAGEDKLPLRPAGFLEGLNVERMVKTVASLDAPEKTLRFADGSTLRYDGGLLAAGSLPKTLDVPGADLPGVWILRTVADARRLVAATADQHKRVAVIGASFIGLEVVSSLRQRGLEVSVISPVRIPFEQQLGRAVGESLQRLHEQKGVRFHLGEEVVRLTGDANGIRAIHLKSGGVVPADIVVVGVGVRPATDFVHGVEFAADGGVRVDEHLHAGHDLYAAGDLAEFPLVQPAGQNQRARIEHWRVAQQHARLAARNLAAGEPRFTLADEGFVPFFWTFHFGQRLNYVGHASGEDEVILDGDPRQPPFLAYYLRDGKVIAAAGTGRDTDLAAIHELLRTGKAPSAAQLRQGGFSPVQAAATADL